MKIPSLQFTLLKRLLILAVIVVVQLPGTAGVFADNGMTPAELRALYEYPNWVASTCSGSPTASNASESTGSINIDSVAKKYGLQSAMIQKLGGDVMATYNADKPPTTPASTMKLIIADTVLRDGEDLSKTYAVTSDIYYDHGNDLGKSRITLEDALTATLDSSSNVGANLLMKSLGGVDSFTKEAQTYGYKNTDVGGYYDPSNDGKNTSTISDEVAAMNHIFSTKGAGYNTAQSALEHSAQVMDSEHNHYGVDDDANKWAGTSTVAGNVAKVNVSGSDYIIGLYINKSSSDPEAVKGIKDGTADLAKTIQSNSSTGASSSANISCGGCNSDGNSSDPTSLSGKDNQEKAYNFFVQEGLTAAQAAGVLANLYNESGVTPTTGAPIRNGVGFGIAQWTFTARQAPLQAFAASQNKPVTDLLVQLQFVWHELSNDKSTLNGLKHITGNNAGSARQAAEFFRDHYEACDMSYSSCSDRGSVGVDMFNQYGGGDSGGGGGSSCQESPDCQTAAGTAKILCEAKKYEGIYYEYGGGHQGYDAFKQGCSDPSNPPNNQPSGGPTNGDPAGKGGNPSPCGLDCSGLVSVAVDDAFNQKFMWSVKGSMQGNGSQGWKPINVSDAQPGDIVTTPEHVEIVDHVKGNTVYTFGAHYTGAKINGVSSPTSYWSSGAWRWTGPGA